VVVVEEEEEEGVSHVIEAGIIRNKGIIRTHIDIKQSYPRGKER
jgi:hypothetical protein